jgi:ATP-dependent helicase HrpA
MARPPIEPRLSRMMLEARRQGCLAEITILAAALSIQDPRERPAEEARQADQIHARFYEPSSDFLTLLNIWNRYHATWKQVTSNNQMKKYCKAHYLSFKRMREWRDIHHQICEILAENVPTHTGGKQIMDAKLRYAAIHKSILSGFLSNIAVRKEKNIFKAAKGREVMIFPGSSLFNSAGEWIVAAEMVETSRLFARTTASIDPGWLEDLGRDLCRYTHLNPRWSRKRGQVVASEQVSLFGLIIASQRTVSYGRIDPDEASDIFIRQALIAGDVRRPLPFMQHNRKLVADVRSMEDRIRRRDVLVSEDEMYRFYKDKLEDISDIRSLERFIKKKRSDAFLRLKKEDLLLYEPGPAVLSQFPDRVRLGRNDYPCSYRFEPGTQTDGLTVKVSSDVAPLVPVEEIDWLVPGLLGEKITALIKGLPKKYRKKLVPVTETVESALKEMPKTEEPLITALANFIYTRFGFNIPASDWSIESLPEYLNMRVAITGPGGEVLRAGRDRSILKQDLSNDLHLDQWESARKSWEKTDITRWDFGDLPESIELQIKDAAAWTVYPGLVVDSSNKNRIDLRLFRHRDTALESHIKGVAALYAVYFSKDLRFLKKNLTLPPELDRPASYFGGARKVEQRMYACVVGKLFRKNLRKQDAFLKHATVVAQKIITTGRKHFEQVLPILQTHHECRSAIYQLEDANKANSVFSRFLNMLKDDLSRLVPENFVELYDPQRLLHIPRYLKAAAIRAERAAVNFEKDRIKAGQVGKFTAGLEELLQTLSPVTTQEKKNAVEEFFWMLEEFKVSLFAQELGTAVPVSVNRLEKKLAEVGRMV